MTSAAVCSQEKISSRDITYIWLATFNGSTASFTCPDNPTLSVNRECSTEGMWQNFDEKGCEVLAEKLASLPTARILVRI